MLGKIRKGSMFKGFPTQKSKMSQGEEGGNEVHLGLPCGRQKEEVKSIGNPAGIGKGTGFGLRERDRDGIGLGHYRLRPEE